MTPDAMADYGMYYNERLKPVWRDLIAEGLDADTLHARLLAKTLHELLPKEELFEGALWNVDAPPPEFALVDVFHSPRLVVHGTSLVDVTPSGAIVEKPCDALPSEMRSLPGTREEFLMVGLAECYVKYYDARTY
jgi:hypothetical protein